MTIATVFTALLPCAAIGSTAAAVAALTHAGLPYSDQVEFLADKNIAYWFLALAGVSIASWTWIVKWLISQLESQRVANTASTTELIAYMRTDHGQMRDVLASVRDLLEQVKDQLKP